MAKVTIPKKLWRVAGRNNVTNFPLVYLCHYENNAAFLSRKATGVYWAGGGYWTKDDPAPKNVDECIFDNEPVEGFRISKQVSRWSTSNVVWRIQDPRGFELEIYSGNMMNIIQSSHIKNGVIQGKCVWGREGGYNFLLPCESQTYKDAVNLTNLRSKKISIRDIKPGDKITIKGEETNEYIFLGRYYLLYMDSDCYRGVYSNYRVITNKRKIYWMYSEKDGKVGYLNSRSTLTVVKHTPSDPIDADAILKEYIKMSLDLDWEYNYNHWKLADKQNRFPPTCSLKYPWPVKVTKLPEGLLDEFGYEVRPYTYVKKFPKRYGYNNTSTDMLIVCKKGFNFNE